MFSSFIPVKRFVVIVSVVVVLVTVATLLLNAAQTVELKRGDPYNSDNSPKIALAYVESFRPSIPDAYMFSHLVYAFAEFNDECDALVLPNPQKLKKMSDLKSQNPDLKVILGVGGYKREGFSEMARDRKKRKSFVKSVKAVIDSIDLDGVDLDWEFPTTELGGHSASPKDDRNYATLVKDLRNVLGKNKWISFYSNNSAAFIDFKRMIPYVDYVHVSGYNLAVPKDGTQAYHQSPLYPSIKTGGWCVKKSIERHIEYGIPPEKILMGIPFFGRGKAPFPTYVECSLFDIYAAGAIPTWDQDAQAPYFADHDGNLLMGYDDSRSIQAKFDFIRTNRLPGVFIWNYDADFDDKRLGRTIQKLRR